MWEGCWRPTIAALRLLPHLIGPEARRRIDEMAGKHSKFWLFVQAVVWEATAA